MGAFFRAEVRCRPWQDTLATWWSRQLPGIAAGSTHGVIRVGHAVRTLRTGVGGPALAELANGLAFWAARWRPLPDATSGASAPGAAAVLDALPELPDRSGLIAQRLDRLTRMRQWPAALAALPAPDDTGAVPAALTALVDAATIRYLRIGPHAPVLLVHTATAPNAVLACSPVLPAEVWGASLAAAWGATAAITITYAGAPGDRPAARPDADNPAAALLEWAADHRDEHVIKFADTAVDSFERTGNLEALAAAHLAADLIDASR